MNRLALENLVHVGFVLKPHGYQGLIKVSLLREEAQDIQTEWVMLIIDNKPVPFFVTSISGQRNEWLLKIDDIDSDEDAKALQGKQVYISAELLPDIDQNTQATLVGYDLIDDQEGILGPIESEYEAGKQHFVTITFQENEVMIPNVTEILYHIDFDKKQVFCNLPEGLLDINS
jgi:16S rRNA processing protein RimM